MASSDVDQKYLARHAALSAADSQLMSASLYQILGLSTMLARKLVRARRLRRLDTTRDTRSLQLYHHIIWLSREGLSILQTFVTPYTQRSRAKNAELQVLAAKLEASFFHIFCLFHNNPLISQTSIPSAAAAATAASTPLSPRDGNGRARRSSTNQPGAKRVETLRETIPSYTSEVSYMTNPYSPAQGTAPSRLQATSSTAARQSPAAPPGLAPIRHPTPTSAFIFPPENFLPYTAIQFENASRLAADLLPGSHPLRLSVAIEHAAFLWDCAKDGDGSRTLARRAIRECHASKEGMSDADFEEAAECVGVLGRMMRREGLGGGNRDSVRSTRSGGALRSSARRASGASAKATSSTKRKSGAAELPPSPGSSQSSPTAVQRPKVSRTRSRSRSNERQKSLQTSPTQISPSTGAAAAPTTSPTTARAGPSGGRERKSSHSTRGSSGSTKSASGGERRSSSERESSALRGSGVTRGAARRTTGASSGARAR